MTDLPTRPLGRTGVHVTTLGFGAMELRGAPRGPEISDEEAERVLNDVLDAGINFIDTSIDYGRSEELIGRFVSHRRDDYFLASKCGCVVGGAQGEHVHTAENIRRGVENSVRLLKTDHLDLVQFHRSLTRHEFEQEGALQEALKLQAEGTLDDLLDGATRIEFTLRFTLSHPGLSTTIVGTRNPAHLGDNIRAAKKGPLPAGVLAEAKRRLATAGSTPEPVDEPARSAVGESARG
jgi:aryl-alcohol dehydrogenase-like predicted oxidoreductase